MAENDNMESDGVDEVVDLDVDAEEADDIEGGAIDAYVKLRSHKGSLPNTALPGV